MPWIAAGVGLLGSVLGADASEDAAGMQADSAAASLALQKQIYDQNRADNQPWKDAGAASLAQLVSGLSSGGQFQRTFQTSDLGNDPGYQFRMNEGQRTIDASAAARGSLFSGGTLKALTRYGQDQGAQEYGAAYGRFNNDQNTRFNRLATVAGISQTANNTGMQTSSQYGNTVADLSGQMANAQASGQIGSANAINSGLQSLGNYYTQKNYMNPSGSFGMNSGWDMGSYSGSNDASMISANGNSMNWFLRNGSGGD